MRIRFLLAGGVAFLLATGCEAVHEPLMTAPNPHTVRLPEQDLGFHLTAEERASIRPPFDVDALERLLAWIEPGARPILLQGFQFPPPGEAVPNVFKMGDPTLQPFLDEVWAPFWELDPESAAFDDPVIKWPGKELARKRLAARRNPP